MAAPRCVVRSNWASAAWAKWKSSRVCSRGTASWSRAATCSRTPNASPSTDNSYILERGHPMYMLEMRSVAKVFRTEQVETHALRSLELQVKEGEFVAVTGPSGSGKTTFLNIAGLLETFTSGTYMLDGQDVSKLGDDARSRLRNQKIGFIFQGFNLIPDLNLFDNVDVPLRYRRMSAGERRERIEKALSQVGLGSRMKHYPNELSGGQQQRAAIARALAGSPR